MTVDPVPDPGRRAELRIRDAIHPATQEPVAEMKHRLDELAEAGHLEAAETIVWGKRLPLDPDDADVASMIGTYQRFRAWAIRTDVDLEPGFRVHEVTSVVTDTSHTVVTVPLVCLAVYQDGDVVEVYPHTDDDDVVTVGQGLERLATRSAPGASSDSGSESSSTTANDTRTTTTATRR